MKLLTKEIEKRFAEIGGQDGKGENAIVVVKFFNPCGAGTWWATEIEEYRMDDRKGCWKIAYTLKEKEQYEKEGYEVDDVIFFGVAQITDTEWGSFSLKELQELRLPMGLRIERDLYCGEKTLKEFNIKGLC
jgi:hypothetical protein